MTDKKPHEKFPKTHAEHQARVESAVNSMAEANRRVHEAEAADRAKAEREKHKR